MLTAKDFQYIYQTGELPSGLHLSKAKIQGSSDEISKEWVSLGDKLNSLAKSLIEDRNSKKTHPPFFTINIKRKEDVDMLRKLGFSVSPIGGLEKNSFESRPYVIEFLSNQKGKS